MNAKQRRQVDRAVVARMRKSRVHRRLRHPADALLARVFRAFVVGANMDLVEQQLRKNYPRMARNIRAFCARRARQVAKIQRYALSYGAGPDEVSEALRA
jgi:hypothetical protein